MKSRGAQSVACSSLSTGLPGTAASEGATAGVVGVAAPLNQHLHSPEAPYVPSQGHSRRPGKTSVLGTSHEGGSFLREGPACPGY